MCVCIRYLCLLALLTSVCIHIYISIIIKDMIKQETVYKNNKQTRKYILGNSLEAPAKRGVSCGHVMESGIICVIRVTTTLTLRLLCALEVA